MKTLLFSLGLVPFLSCGSLFAATISFDLSPAAGAALTSTNYANGDHTLGISAPNAVGQPNSPGTGGEFGAGITLDDVTGVLTYNIAYGSDFGFVDLREGFTIAHIHGSVAVGFPTPNTGAGIITGITHTAGSSSGTGSFSGSVTLSAAQQANLLNNLYYINIHSSFAGGGEIRGQLVAVPEPSMLGFVALSGVLLLGARRRRS